MGGKVKHCAEPKNAPKSCKAAGVDLPTHYKNMYNVAQAVKGMDLGKAVTYLEAVVEQRRCIPYMSSPCHVQVILEEKEETVEKAPEKGGEIDAEADGPEAAPCRRCISADRRIACPR